MSSQYVSDPMQEMFIFETSQQLEQLEQSVINTESEGYYSSETVNEIFRIMHTIKGSAAMMLLNNISMVAHCTEDLFYFIREDKPRNINVSTLCDIVLEAVDFMKSELGKIKNGYKAHGNCEGLKEKTKEYLNALKENNNIVETSINKDSEQVTKQFYISSNRFVEKINNNTFKVIIRFQDGCDMENIRAFAITNSLKDITEEFKYFPEDIINNNDSSEIIKIDGFKIYFKTDNTYDFMYDFFMEAVFVDNIDLVQLDNDEEYSSINSENSLDNELKIPRINEKETQSININNQGQSIISVGVEKLDRLMDLVGEMVIAEAMVTENPDLKGLTLDNFSKSAQQLKR